VIKDSTGLHQDELARPEFQKYKLGISIRFPTELPEFIEKTKE
jgi:hypothetical protein